MKNLEFGWRELVITILMVTTTSLSIYIYKQDNLSEEHDDTFEDNPYLGFDHNGIAYNINDNNYNEIIKTIEELEQGENTVAISRLESIIEKDSSEIKIKNFSRSYAVDSLKRILASVEKDIEGEERTLEERIKLLDNDKTDIHDVLSNETINSLYLSEEFEDVKFNRQFAASSLLIFHDLVEQNTGSDEFDPLSNSYDEIVYLDKRFLTAHIPLDLFIGSRTGVAFEMQYIDGEWKLNPYTSMMSLNLMGLLSEDKEG